MTNDSFEIVSPSFSHGFPPPTVCVKTVADKIKVVRSEMV